MFEGWGEFYLLVGSAATGLIGLLFVVASLTSGLARETIRRGARLYMTPIVFHLAMIVVLSAVALAPGLPRAAVALIASAVAAAGAFYALWIIRGIRGALIAQPAHWSDSWCYGVAPACAYLVLGLVSVAFWRHAPWAETGQGAVAVALLLLGIRNAWDLATWLAPRAAGAEEDAPGA